MLFDFTETRDLTPATCSSNRSRSLEQPDQIDDQNNHHHQLQHKRAALMKLIDHEAIQFFRRVDFLIHQVFVVGNTNLRSSNFVETRGKHVAKKLDRVVGALGQFVHIKQYSMQSAGSPRRAPARPDAGTVIHEIVNTGQFASQQLVIVSKFEKLRVGVFQQLNNSFCAARSVVEKRAVPADHSQVVWIVRDLRLHDLLLLPIRERNVFATDDLRDASSLSGKQFSCRRIASNITHMKNEIIFMQPGIVKFDQRRTSALDFLFDDLLRKAGEVGIPNPAASETDKRVPIARKWQLEYHAKHTVIVILDLHVKPFATFKNQRFNRLNHWSALKAHVSWSRMFKTSLLSASSEDVTQSVKVYFLADIELDQHQNRPLQRLIQNRHAGLDRNRGQGWIYGFHRISAFFCPVTNEFDPR